MAKNHWPDGTPRSQGNAFDWQTGVLDDGLRKTVEGADRVNPAGNAALTQIEPRVTYYYQRAVAS